MNNKALFTSPVLTQLQGCGIANLVHLLNFADNLSRMRLEAVIAHTGN